MAEFDRTVNLLMEQLLPLPKLVGNITKDLLPVDLSQYKLIFQKLTS